ncbi:hypothetical protein OROGR_001916 [Orobanche gracilis]
MGAYRRATDSPRDGEQCDSQGGGRRIDDRHRRRQEAEEVEEASASGSASGNGSSRRRLKFCDCGVESPPLTSRTGVNPGRREYRRRVCGFFEWYDEVGSERQKALIGALRRNIVAMGKIIKILAGCLAIAMILILLLVVAYVSK